VIGCELKIHKSYFKNQLTKFLRKKHTKSQIADSQNFLKKLIQNNQNSAEKQQRWMSADLWCHVVRCAAERSCGLVTSHTFLTHAKISDLYVTLRVKHNVVQLQVSITEFNTDKLRMTKVINFTDQFVARLQSVMQ